MGFSVQTTSKEKRMTTIMPGDKNLRNAIAWIEERRHDNPDLKKLMAQAAMQFDLTPPEELALARFYRDEATSR
jgi:hypothetical protein